MAALLLLMRSGLGILAVLVGVACATSRTIHLPRIAGTVVDERRVPVEGVAVLTWYEVQPHRPLGAATSREHAVRWAITDDKGGFSFDEVRFQTSWHTGEFPLNFVLFHPRFGRTSTGREPDPVESGDMTLEFRRHPATVGDFAEPFRVAQLCGGLPHGTYLRCCEFAYGAENEQCRRIRERTP